MIETLILTVGLILLTWSCMLRPIRTAQQRATRKRFNDEFERFQLSTVQRLFPELQDLSTKEIKQLYRFRAAYNGLSVLEHEEGLAHPWIQ